ELKKNPHRLVYLTTETEGKLLLTTEKGITKEIEIAKVAISDRISNGTFAIDEKTEGELTSVLNPQELMEES
ncbi:MAG: hypothetical protein RR492_02015, partial [Enterococcus sp.]